MVIKYGVILILVLIIARFFAYIQWRKNLALLRTVTETNRGTWSERNLIIKLLKHNIPASTIYHDLYVEQYKGRYSQIDAVVVTKVGLIVFEVKDYSGWIFGQGDQKYWTKVLAYGREKHSFYNPILQNEGHIKALKQKLSEVADIPFYSVVIFYGRCLLREVSYIPDSTYVGYAGNVMSIINNILKTNLPANYKDKQGVINILREATANGNNYKIVNQHIQNVYNYYR